MQEIYIIMFFILGIILGSFYNVVGYRITKKQSIVYPPSTCPNCKHILKPIELIPIISYIFLRGKCSKCKKKISIIYPLFELATGILFSIAYLKFGFSIDLIIALLFISMLIIVVISDIHFMIIEDSVLIFFFILMSILLLYKGGLSLYSKSLFNGVISFLIIYGLKKMGDLIFEKESMGHGDLKLMFVVGMIISYKGTFLCIFLASFLALPIALAIMTVRKNKENSEIPFGPFLSVAALLIYLIPLRLEDYINLFN